MMRGLLLLAAGCGAVVIGLFFIVPTVVNFPDTWFGIVVVILFLAVGVALIYRGARSLTARHDKALHGGAQGSRSQGDST